MIQWNKKLSLPTAIQDAGIVEVNNVIYLIGGYCSGFTVQAVRDADANLAYQKAYLKKKHKFIRGFTTRVSKWWPGRRSGEVGRRSGGLGSGGGQLAGMWQNCTEFPGSARGSIGVTSIGTVIYCVGGYSFIPDDEIMMIPLEQRKKGKAMFMAHSDCYQYHTLTDQWSRLPDLPLGVTNLNLVNDGRYLYAVCGAGIETNAEKRGLAMNISMVGNHIWRLDTRKLGEAQWEKFITCPGTHRMDAYVALVGGGGVESRKTLYIIGGCYPNSRWHYNRAGHERYYNIRDNWKYCFEDGSWTRLASHDFNTSNWATSLTSLTSRGFYLVGGCYYYRTLDSNRTHVVNPKVLRHKKGALGQNEFIISKDIYYYDLAKDQFDLVDQLPFPINKPMCLTISNRLHVMGGESIPTAGLYYLDEEKEGEIDSQPVLGYEFQGEFFGYHSDVNLIGNLRG